MPRKKTDNVTEHRVTLGDWERKKLEDHSDAILVKNVGIGVGIASVGIGGTYVAYKIGKAIYEWGDDVVDFMTEQETSPEGNKSPPRWARWLISFAP
ncbi:MAG: hypothetical protein ACPHX8_06875 [Candidatus Poseidoniaceae archaeon]